LPVPVPTPNYPQVPAHGYPAVAAPLVRKQGAWGLWWVVGLTFGIYYYFWYHRINRELSNVLGVPMAADGQWWSQLIPFYNLYGLAKTAQRVNAAHALVGSPTRVGVVVTWLWAPMWFSSHTRYLQRRINILHDVLAAKSSGR
jgi:signal transduction histidine kinase